MRFPEMFFNREVTETQSFAKTISLNLKVELVVRIENPIVGAFGLSPRDAFGKNLKELVVDLK
jgi:hypothetical protein